MSCELCESQGGHVVWRDAGWRVVRVDDRSFPAFYRVISNHHVKEFSDLLAPERRRCMDIVVAIERTLREQLAPEKINLASLGNVTQHLHWHVIARFGWDSHYPQPVWGSPQRRCDDAVQRLPVTLADLDRAVATELA